jgi:hypothetical protein
MKTILFALALTMSTAHADDCYFCLLDSGSSSEPVVQEGSYYYFNRYDDGSWSVYESNTDGSHAWVTPLYDDDGDVSGIVRREYE